jgi:hypothetical protein
LTQGLAIVLVQFVEQATTTRTRQRFKDFVHDSD